VSITAVALFSSGVIRTPPANLTGAYVAVKSLNYVGLKQTDLPLSGRCPNKGGSPLPIRYISASADASGMATYVRAE
jgi:hypothetical protein